MLRPTFIGEFLTIRQGERKQIIVMAWAYSSSAQALMSLRLDTARPSARSRDLPSTFGEVQLGAVTQMLRVGHGMMIDDSSALNR
ncbi:MAG: hypothetical protein NT013_00215 [Planctomycetia bacterium]|nr:hypothetical protein [Planctomycetia bacterium]